MYQCMTISIYDNSSFAADVFKFYAFYHGSMLISKLTLFLRHAALRTILRNLSDL